MRSRFAARVAPALVVAVVRTLQSSAEPSSEGDKPMKLPAYLPDSNRRQSNTPRSMFPAVRAPTPTIDTIPGLVWISQPDGSVDFLNPRWREHTGMTLAEASGWGWRAAIHRDDLPSLESYWSSVLQSGKPGETEARLRRFDGVHRWLFD